MIRTPYFAWFFLLVLTTPGGAQDPATGLSRIYIQPVNGSFEKLLGFELLREHVPVLVIESPQSADCVLGWTKVPGEQGRMDFVLADRKTRTITWEFGIRESKLNGQKGKPEQKLSAQVIHSLSKAGAYCGGAAFSAPTESADQRVKDFKPPTFNW